MEEKFDFENLIAWHRAIEFVDIILEKTDNFYKSNGNFRLREQLDACSSSIPMNIAEGKGRYSKKEFKQFLYYSTQITHWTLFERKLSKIVVKHGNFNPQMQP